jgi:predicted nucleic acid-binding protein
MAERVLIDTGPIVAVLCREDAQHTTCVQTLRSIEGELYTCWPVISEAVFLLGGRADRIQSLLQMLVSGAIRCESLGTEREAAPWLVNFYGRFGDHAPDLADAVLVYLAEREHVEKVFTLDLRDFAIYRTSDNRALEVVTLST